MHQIPSTYPPQTNSNPSLQFPEHEHLNCPRCDSDNTKFCYYNNYNLSQPRHYCKNCRRYWTKGGTLRKIPVGGGVRKSTKRSPSTSNKRPAESSPPVPILKPESSPVLDFNNNNNQSRTSGSEKDGLKISSVVTDGESSGARGNGWADLSIFTSGSSFR